jgi:hypothetical protein
MSLLRQLFSVSLLSMFALGCDANLSGSGIDDETEGGLGIVGTKPDNGKHPAVAALTVYGGGAFCSGVLVDRYTILTTARCITGIVNPYDITVYFGDKAKKVCDAQGLAIPVWDYVIDPGYNPYTLENDIGLLYLWYPVDSIQPADLALDLYPSDIGNTLSYVGFRPNYFVGGSGPKTGAEVTFEDFNDESLMYMWRGNDADLPTEVPRFDPQEDCLLGSGSPAFMMIKGKEKVIGINSYSSPDCESYGVNQRPHPWTDPEPAPVDPR